MAAEKTGMTNNKQQRIFITTDTHFGHDALITKHRTRPENYESLVINSWKSLVTVNDIVIHLGDFILTSSSKWDDYINELPGRIILVKGNHDQQSIQWYMKRGVAFCCERFEWTLYGLKIVFTHEPIDIRRTLKRKRKPPFDINIHGHIHDDSDFDSMHRPYKKDNYHYLISMEQQGYTLFRLDHILKKIAEEKQRREDIKKSREGVKI